MGRDINEGNWIPMDKRGVRKLPRDRAYSEVEAMYSLSCDLDNGFEKSVREYARMWQWSRKKVANFCKSALHVNFQEGSHSGATQEPEKFTWINNLQRRGDQVGSHSGATTKETETKTKRPAAKKRTKKPWSGRGKDLDSLLACDAYVEHLATNSPVLGQWSFAEIRAWARSMVAKTNEKRATRNEAPVSSPIALLQVCTARVRPNERPENIQSAVPPELSEIADAMGVGK